MWRISAFVAQIRRTSIGMVCVLPKRLICRFSIAVSSFDCMGSERLPISSRNKVPLVATSIRPAFDFLASVKAPFSNPNSSLSKSCSGILPRSMVTKGLPYRGEQRYSSRAITSFPVPFSPKIRMLASVLLSLFMVANTSCMTGDSPIMSPSGELCPLSASTCSFKMFTSR